MAEVMKYSVEITGQALSFLYYSASFSNEGFLLGKVEEKQVEVISDTNECGVKQETIIRISGVFPCTNSSKLFHHETASPSEDIMDVVKTNHGDAVIVGWYYGRRNCQLKPSFRETALHSKLSLQFSEKNTWQFVFCLVQDLLNKVSITREFQSKFFHFDNVKRKWLQLVGSILNLNQKSNPNKSLYKSMPTLEPSLLELFEKKSNNSGLTGSDLVEGIIKNGNNFLTKSLQRIAKLSSEIAQVELDITQLHEERESEQEESDEANNDEDEILAGECFKDKDELPPSPPLSNRRKTLRQSSLAKEELNTSNTTITNEPATSSAVRRKSFVKEELNVSNTSITNDEPAISSAVRRRSSVSPMISSSSKMPSQEY